MEMGGSSASAHLHFDIYLGLERGTSAVGKALLDSPFVR